MNDLDHVRQLAVITDDRAADLVSTSVKDDLVARVTAAPAAGTVRWRRSRGRTVLARHGVLPAGRRWIGGVPAGVAAGGALLAVGLLAVGLLGSPGQPAGSLGSGVANAAMVITRHGHYIDVVVRNPKAVVADVRKYRAELKAAGLDVQLRLMPVPPPMVGTLVGFGTNHGWSLTHGLKPIGRKGIRISRSFRGEADIYFGRPGRAGEAFALTERATAPGEVLAGLHITGRRVSAVLPLVAGRGASVGTYRIERRTADGRIVDKAARTASGRYFVYDSLVIGPGKVLLVVGPTARPPLAHTTPAGG